MVDSLYTHRRWTTTSSAWPLVVTMRGARVRRSNVLLRVRFRIIGNARIDNVGKSQSCMVSKVPIIWKQTVLLLVPAVVTTVQWRCGVQKTRTGGCSADGRRRGHQGPSGMSWLMPAGGGRRSSRRSANCRSLNSCSSVCAPMLRRGRRHSSSPHRHQMRLRRRTRQRRACCRCCLPRCKTALERPTASQCVGVAVGQRAPRQQRPSAVLASSSTSRAVLLVGAIACAQSLWCSTSGCVAI